MDVPLLLEGMFFQMLFRVRCGILESLCVKFVRVTQLIARQVVFITKRISQSLYRIFRVFQCLFLQMVLFVEALLDVERVLRCYFHFLILRIGRFHLVQLESESTVFVVKLQELY